MTAQPAPQTVAYLDPAEGTLKVITPNARTVRTLKVPANVTASHHGRQAAWARNALRTAGYTPDQSTQRLPYSILGIPVS